MNLHLVVPDPIEIDQRPCGLCDLKIDQHRMVDTGEGPEFFCEEMPLDYAADIARRWELADPRDRWQHTGEAPSKISATPPRREPYRPAESTGQAFWYVASLDDPDHLARWLARHPDDAPHLLKIWKARQC